MLMKLTTGPIFNFYNTRSKLLLKNDNLSTTAHLMDTEAGRYAKVLL